MISVIIPVFNEPFLYFTLRGLLKELTPDKGEIILVDDCSDDPVKIDNLQYPNVRVIRNSRRQGVGTSFEIGVRHAKNEIIVLMGSDVIVQDGYRDKVSRFVSRYPNSIGCSVCLSGNPTHLDPAKPFSDTKRYGATIVPFVLTEDIRSDSPVAYSEPYHVGMLESRWIKKEPIEEVSDVPCLYGAFYFTTRQWFDRIHGWDGSHKEWGCLEAWLSIKCWLYGGTCKVVKSLETLHIFEKYQQDYTKCSQIGGKWEDFWHNKIFCAYTMLPFADFQRLVKKVYDTRIKYDLHTRLFNLGYSLVKKNEETVNKIKSRNAREFVHDFDWFLSKFNIIKNF